MKLLVGNLRYSSWSIRAWLAAKLSGQLCEIEVLPLFEPATNARLAVAAPAGKMPILLDDDTTIWDSLSIVEYLAERAPHLWPTKAAARATARSACAEMHSSFQPLRQHCTMNTGRHYPGFILSNEAQVNVQRIEALWAECQNRFAGNGAFLFGDFSAADCYFAPVVSRFITYDVTLGASAQRYVAAMQAHPLIQDWFAQAAAEPWVISKYEY
jgi:glutathione S-transferase